MQSVGALWMFDLRLGVLLAVQLIKWKKGIYEVSDNPLRGEIVIGGPSVTVRFFNVENSDGSSRWDDPCSKCLHLNRSLLEMGGSATFVSNVYVPLAMFRK